jgi:hypothetical protein
VRTVRFLNIHSVAGDRILAPNVDSMVLTQANLKSAVRFNRPNRPKRVRPGPNQPGLTALLEHRASRKQRDGDNDQSKRDLFVHDQWCSDHGLFSRKNQQRSFTESYRGLNLSDVNF